MWTTAMERVAETETRRRPDTDAAADRGPAPGAGANDRAGTSHFLALALGAVLSLGLPIFEGPRRRR